MSKIIFTATEDELLVELVAKHASLYDLSHALYKDSMVKENAWKEIAEALSRSVEDCKKRWRNIKDTYNKRKKKGKSTGSAALTSAKWALANMLSFLDQTEHKRSSTSIGINETNQTEEEDFQSNIGSDCIFQESPRPSSSASVLTTNVNVNSTLSHEASTSSDTVKRQRPFSKSNRNSKRVKTNEDIIAVIKERGVERSELLKQISQNKPDAVDLFFQSMAASVKTFRPDLINEAKLKTMQLVFELERRNAIPPQPPQSESATVLGEITQNTSPIRICKNFRS